MDRFNKISQLKLKMTKSYNQQLTHHQRKTPYLPMLCSNPNSIQKEVTLPKSRGQQDPLSPKISCIGQVKKNNKINGFFSTSLDSSNQKLYTITRKSNTSVKYLKLKRLFSTKKNLLTSGSVGNCTTVAKLEEKAVKCRRRQVVDDRCSSPINILELDPPLPVVVKKLEKDHGGDCDNLWKRRSGSKGGIELKSLQIQRIEINSRKVTV